MTRATTRWGRTASAVTAMALAAGSLAASLVYTLNDTFSFSVDGQNLNNPTLKYYSLNKDQPRAFYKNGAQYYFTVRAKF